jgi:hypothetical protein
MIVDAGTLDVLPKSDEVLHSVAGEYIEEVELGDRAWSNELVLHVLELKTLDPAPALRGLDEGFADDVADIHRRLLPLHGRLLPTAAHPWMDPATETRLWPHDANVIYSTFDRIFDCKGHGWSNLQCTHLNLPFAGDAEFGRLHAAIRLVLPLIPALAASSPVLDSRLTGLLDSRMHYYRENQKKIPSITGAVIPEPVYTEREYREEILGPMYAAIEPHDPDGILRHEWLNARGAIARFERDAIEIRTIDIQECPAADLAIVHSIVCVLRALVSERWQPLDRQKRADTGTLNTVLLATTRDAESAVIADGAFLDAFGIRARRASAREVWSHLVETVVAPDADFTGDWQTAIATILSEGTLARRIVRSLCGETPSVSAMLGIARDDLHREYLRLADCLKENEIYHATR